MAEAIAPRAILKGEDHGAGQSRKLAEPGGGRHGPLFDALDAPARPRPRGDRLHQSGCEGQGDRRVLGQPAQRRRTFRDIHSAGPRARPDAMPGQIAAILAHELVHAAVGIAAGHGKAFKRIAVGLGLVGPMRATTPGDAFLAAVAPILAAAGPCPMPGSTLAARRRGRRSRRRGCLNASARRAAIPSEPRANGWSRPARPCARSRGMDRCGTIRSMATTIARQNRDRGIASSHGRLRVGLRPCPTFIPPPPRPGFQSGPP